MHIRSNKDVNMIERKKDFTPRLTEEERFEKLAVEGEIIKIRLNKQERELLNIVKKTIAQPKDSTCFKQCLEIASTVVDPSTPNGNFLRILLGNRKRADRLGIPLESTYL